MADQVPVRSHVNAVFEWRQQDIAKVTLASRDVIFPFLGSGLHFSATVGRKGPPEIKQDHTSLESWGAALSPDWDWFLINANSTDWTRHAWVEFKLKERQIRANLDMAGSEVVPLTNVLAEFQRVMSLNASPLSVPEPLKQKERLEGRYHVERPEDVTWFQKLLTVLESWAGPEKHFNGSLSLLSSPQFRRSPSQYADWKNQCGSNWKDILDLNASLDNEVRGFQVRYYTNRADLSVTLASYHAKELPDQFMTLEKDLPMIPSRDLAPSDAKMGERRRYFATEQIDKAWFERCIALVRSIPKEKFSFQGRYRLADLDGQDYSLADFEAWRQEVTSEWDGLTSVYAWFFAPGISITMDLDLLRDSISLELQSVAEDMVTGSFNKLEQDLKLDKVKGNPYRYRRFLRTFEIKSWTTNKKFAEALREAVKFAFPERTPGRRLAMPTAYVTVGEAKEDLEPFTDFQLFCARIESPDEFTRAELVLEGPRGRHLDIFVSRKTRILTLRTSIERADLDPLMRPFQNALDLTLKESKDEPEKKEPKGDKSNIALVVTTAASILCVLITGSIALLTSQAGLASLHKQYSLEITQPRSKDEAPVEYPGQQLRVEWKLKAKSIIGESSDLHSPASVYVLRGVSTQPETYHGSDGTAIVTLTPGSNSVKVVADIDHSSMASINVVVPSKEAVNTSAIHGPKTASKPGAKVNP